MDCSFYEGAIMARKYGMDPRRHQEMKDAGMIQEDHSATANLPQQVKYHDWPKADHYTDYGLDDTIRGIDKQEDMDERQMKRHMQRGKY
jgi:hypothetical protein